MSYISRHSWLILISAAMALAAGYIIIFPDVGELIRPARPIAPPEIVLGSTSAGIQIIEVSSPSCQECARFHREVFPLLLRDYVSSGKARYGLRILPVSPLDFAAAALAGCVRRDNYLAFLDLLFRNQEKWANVSNLIQEKASLISLGQTAGLSSDKARGCMESEDRIAGLRLEAQSMTKRLDGHKLPSLIINGRVYDTKYFWPRIRTILGPSTTKP